MKRILALTAVLFTAVTIETHAVGLGVQFGGNALGGFDTPGFSILISPSEQIHIAGTWYVQSNGMTIGASGDYWFLPIDITQLGPGALTFYLGAGIYGQIAMWEDYFGVAAGARLPLGLDWKMDVIDVFVQAVPFTGIGLLPSPGFGGFHIDVNLGVRFWIGG
jgi:hypothetical protein